MEPHHHCIMNVLWMMSSVTSALLLPRHHLRPGTSLSGPSHNNPKHEFRLLGRPLSASDRSQQQDDDECENEEECEIDWDSMPGFADEDDAGVGASTTNPQNLRNRLEMAWALDEAKEECDVFEPITCGGSPCPQCRTSGRTVCRFCHGRIYNERLRSICNICDEQGYEVCGNCRGSGWVADWTAWGERPGSTLPMSSGLAP